MHTACSILHCNLCSLWFLPYFSTLSQNGLESWKNFLEHVKCFDLPCNSFPNISHFKKNSGRVYKRKSVFVWSAPCSCHVFNQPKIFVTSFGKNIQIPNFMEIRPVLDKLFHTAGRQAGRQAGRETDRQTDGQTDRQTDRRTDGQTDKT